MSTRREVITLLGGAAAAWPMVARAQQADRMRRVGVLIAGVEADPRTQFSVAAFTKALQERGWLEGRNIQIDRRWHAFDSDSARGPAAEIIGLGPDVILGVGEPAVVALRQQTSTIPIVFIQSGDPVSYGVVLIDLYSRAASYVDRILRGDKPDTLPVQAPTKFEFVINLKTAKALGLTVSPAMLIGADEVIE